MFHRYKCPDDSGWLGWFEGANGDAIAWVGLDRKVVFLKDLSEEDEDARGAFPEGDEECDCDCDDCDCEDLDDIDDEDIQPSLLKPPSHPQCRRDGGRGYFTSDECCPHKDQDCEHCQGFECLDRYQEMSDDTD